MFSGRFSFWGSIQKFNLRRLSEAFSVKYASSTSSSHSSKMRMENEKIIIKSKKIERIKTKIRNTEALCEREMEYIRHLEHKDLVQMVEYANQHAATRHNNELFERSYL